MLYHKIDTFHVSKDEWNKKENTCKFMKTALYTLWYTKRYLSAWNSEKIESVPLATNELH